MAGRRVTAFISRPKKADIKTPLSVGLARIAGREVRPATALFLRGRDWSLLVPEIETDGQPVPAVVDVDRQSQIDLFFGRKMLLDPFAGIDMFSTAVEIRERIRPRKRSSFSIRVARRLSAIKVHLLLKHSCGY